MFTTAVTFALAATLVASAPVARSDKPASYAEGYLEPYATYHTRYLALSCQTKHNTDFFTQCCSPLLADELLSTRPSQCIPSAEESSSAIEYASAAAVATTTASADLDAQTAYAQAATTTSSAQAAAETTASSSSSNSGSTTGGFATFFYQGGNAGACGTVHSDSDYIVAMTSKYWSDNFSSSSYCGKQVHITNTNNGKSVTATVADACPSCVNQESIDLSVGAFNAIASESDGMVPISWYWA